MSRYTLHRYCIMPTYTTLKETRKRHDILGTCLILTARKPPNNKRYSAVCLNDLLDDITYNKAL